MDDKIEFGNITKENIGENVLTTQFVVSKGSKMLESKYILFVEGVSVIPINKQPICK